MQNSCAITAWRDRKSTRLNSSHGYISYAVFCLKKKKLKPKALNSSTVNNRQRSHAASKPTTLAPLENVTEHRLNYTVGTTLSLRVSATPLPTVCDSDSLQSFTTMPAQVTRHYG